VVITGTGQMGPGASLYTEGPENLTLLPQISPDRAVHILVTVLMFPHILEYSGNIACFNTGLLISRTGMWVLYITYACYKLLDMSDLYITYTCYKLLDMSDFELPL
jgi:hypothetical protein